MKNRPPHHKVFTRLAPSKIHGVGVFAIGNIKKGVYIFYGDDEKLIWIHRSKLRNLPRPLKRLYDDFCVVKGDQYVCPKNFNQLTVAWYLNNSDNPNVAIDKNYNFYALRNIQKGEELTTDYSTFSDR